MALHIRMPLHHPLSFPSSCLSLSHFFSSLGKPAGGWGGGCRGEVGEEVQRPAATEQAAAPGSESRAKTSACRRRIRGARRVWPPRGEKCGDGARWRRRAETGGRQGRSTVAARWRRRDDAGGDRRHAARPVGEAAARRSESGVKTGGSRRRTGGARRVRPSTREKHGPSCGRQKAHSVVGGWQGRRAMS